MNNQFNNNKLNQFQLSLLVFLAVAFAAPAPEPGALIAPTLAYKAPLAYGALPYPGLPVAPLTYGAPALAYNYPAYNYNYNYAAPFYGKIY